jgi:hypothetical protein
MVRKGFGRLSPSRSAVDTLTARRAFHRLGSGRGFRIGRSSVRAGSGRLNGVLGSFGLGLCGLRLGVVVVLYGEDNVLVGALGEEVVPDRGMQIVALLRSDRREANLEALPCVLNEFLGHTWLRGIAQGQSGTSKELAETRNLRPAGFCSLNIFDSSFRFVDG